VCSVPPVQVRRWCGVLEGSVRKDDGPGVDVIVGVVVVAAVAVVVVVVGMTVEGVFGLLVRRRGGGGGRAIAFAI
jgi:uncharacterized protein (DUF983 family)